GTAKSGPPKMLRRPLDRAERRYLENWQAELKACEEADEEQRGRRPVPKRCLVSDTTTESLGVTLCENPRGVAMVRGELSGLLAGMNQYKGGRGHDRQVYLDLWDGEPLLIDRKSDRARQGGPLYVNGAFLAIFGTLQPDVLGRLRGETVRGAPPPDDGFVDRFLISFPRPLPAQGETWREVSGPALEAWAGVVEYLLGLRMGEQPGEPPPPFYVHLTGGGKR